VNFSEAFQALGYTLNSPRQDWSAERDGGVCISLWQMELAFRNGRPFYDSMELGGDHGNWRDKVGNRKRIAHLSRAMSDFDGFVDAIIVTGKPDQGYGDALPWLPSQRDGTKWRILSFDAVTGHFSTSPEHFIQQVTC